MAKEFACQLPQQIVGKLIGQKCCLCQEDTTDLLKSSAEGYTIMGKNIPLFHEVNALPIPQYIRRLNDAEGIESTMKKKNDKYLNLCKIKVYNTNPERAQKRDTSPMPSGRSSECKSPTVFRSTLRSKDQQPDPVENLHHCFICDKELPLSA
ncbi:unnamed protein product [Mytilus coruscus]|uniref:Uncharacterized protein n=1 Tax=Mytilus coruscus TaxID=42192 RepID=A0A6J8F092_MYTCO|nr:unnamed protein product [Mytilus coruscus]